MTVQLDENGRPVAWGGDQIEGEDIPNPPLDLIRSEDTHARWDREKEVWIEDPDWTPPNNPSVRRDRVSTLSKDEFRNARSNGDMQAQLDILFEILTGEQP